MKRLVITAFLLLLTCCAQARNAQVFTTSPSNASKIDPKVDHYVIIFEGGWISQKDSILRTILTNNSKLVAEADGTTTFFDQNQLKTSTIFNDTDIGHTLDRAWGGSHILITDSLPADTKTNIKANATIFSDDRLKGIVSAFSSNPLPAGLTAQPYVAYAALADSIMSALLNPTNPEMPFVMQVDVSPQGTFNEFYVIGIVSNKDHSDTTLAAMTDSTKLTYDETSSRLSYNSNSVTDHSWAVFKVEKAASPNIAQLTLNSTAPWAVLAVNNFYFPTLPDLSNASDVAKQDKSSVNQLQSVLALLQKEPRFSQFDRAAALSTFAQQAKQIIDAACTAGHVASADCATPQIDLFVSNIGSLFGLTPSQHQNALTTGQQANQSLRTRLRSQ